MICCLSTAGRVVRFLDLTLTFLFIWFPPFSNIFQSLFCVLDKQKIARITSQSFIQIGVCFSQTDVILAKKGLCPKNKKASTITAFRHSDTTDKITIKTKMCNADNCFYPFGQRTKNIYNWMVSQYVEVVKDISNFKNNAHYFCVILVFSGCL